VLRADKSGMDRFWQFNEASVADAGKAQPRAVEVHPSGAEDGASFLSQMEQTLGDGTEPDSEFFVDSWTVGLGAASENLRRRQKKLKSREHETPVWCTFPPFPPLFVSRAKALVEEAWPLREAHAEEGSSTDMRWHGDDESDDWHAADEVEMACPLALESAHQVLGIAATSTREQIRAAYRKMAGRYHPDRVARSGAREQKLASDRMALVNEAYRLLCTSLAERGRAFRNR